MKRKPRCLISKSGIYPLNTGPNLNVHRRFRCVYQAVKNVRRLLNIWYRLNLPRLPGSDKDLVNAAQGHAKIQHDSKILWEFYKIFQIHRPHLSVFTSRLTLFKTAHQSALALLTFLSDLWVLLRSPSTESHFSTWQHSLSIFVLVSHGLFLESIRYRRKNKVEIPEIETKQTLNDKYNLNRQISSAFLLTFIPDKMHDYSEFLRVIYNLQRLKATDCFIKKLHHRCLGEILMNRSLNKGSFI